MDIIV